jgi:hypothetical protein
VQRGARVLMGGSIRRGRGGREAQRRWRVEMAGVVRRWNAAGRRPPAWKITGGPGIGRLLGGGYGGCPPPETEEVVVAGAGCRWAFCDAAARSRTAIAAAARALNDFLPPSRNSI